MQIIQRIKLKYQNQNNRIRSKQNQQQMLHLDQGARVKSFVQNQNLKGIDMAETRVSGIVAGIEISVLL